MLGTLLLLASCAQHPRSGIEPPPPGLTSAEGEAAWHTFIAELAVRRGQPRVAAEQYLLAARLSADPRVAERAAILAYREDLPDLATDAAGIWVQRAPESTDAHRMLAGLAVRMGRPEEAVPHLEFLLAEGPEDRENAWLVLMVMLGRESNQATALEAFRYLVAAHEEEPEAHYSLAALALDSDRHDLALESARRVLELAPEWPRGGLMLARVQIARAQVEEGLATAREVVSRTGDDFLRLEYAGLLADADRLDDARATLAEILADRPGMPDALLAAGLLELRAERPQEARVHFTNLLGTGQRNLDALYYLAVLAEQTGESANALQLYLRVRSGRHFPHAQVQVGRLLFQLGQQEAAIEHLRNFARRFPRHSEAAVLVEGGLLIEIGELEEALSVYDEELEKSPDARSVRYARALLYERLDRVDEALADLFELVGSDPEDASALNALGYTLADRTHRYEEALGYISAALEKRPDDAAVIDSMGWVQYRLGNLELAREYLARAWSLFKDPEVAAHYGEVLWVTGERERAVEIWNTAQQSDAEHRKLKETMRRFLGEGEQ